MTPSPPPRVLSTHRALDKKKKKKKKKKKALVDTVRPAVMRDGFMYI